MQITAKGIIKTLPNVFHGQRGRSRKPLTMTTCKKQAVPCKICVFVDSHRCKHKEGEDGAQDVGRHLAKDENIADSHGYDSTATVLQVGVGKEEQENWFLKRARGWG